MTAESFCSGTEGLFKLLGIAIIIIKIAIPIILIVFGMLDMGKAVTSGKDEDIKKQLGSFLRRAIAAVLVFFVPTIVGIIMQAVNESIAGAGACGYAACIQYATGVPGGGNCTN